MASLRLLCCGPEMTFCSNLATAWNVHRRVPGQASPTIQSAISPSKPPALNNSIITAASGSEGEINHNCVCASSHWCANSLPTLRRFNAAAPEHVPLSAPARMYCPAFTCARCQAQQPWGSPTRPAPCAPSATPQPQSRPLRASPGACCGTGRTSAVPRQPRHWPAPRRARPAGSGP